MAIVKTAKNVSIVVQDKDTIIVSGRYNQSAERLIIESIEKDIKLSTPKKVCSTGNKE